MKHLLFESVSPEQTEALGAALGGLLRGGEVLALEGPLGVGKTQLVRGLARGLDVPGGQPVISPTFVLIREYAGRRDLLHCDAYRLGGAEELLDLGLFDEAAERGAVVAIEWASRVAEVLPDGTWWITGRHAGETTRRYRLELPEAVAAEVAAAAAAAGLVTVVA